MRRLVSSEPGTLSSCAETLAHRSTAASSRSQRETQKPQSDHLHRFNSCNCGYYNGATGYNLWLLICVVLHDDAARLLGCGVATGRHDADRRLGDRYGACAVNHVI